MSVIDRDTQKQCNLGKGLIEEYGRYNFSGTALTVELPVIYGHECFSAIFSTAAPDNTVPEVLSTDRTITSQGITVTRTISPQRLASGDASDCIASYNYEGVPVGIAPCAGTITSVKVINKTQAGGTPLINLGDDSDADAHIANAEAIAMPADGALVTVDTATDFVGNAFPVVAAGDVITFTQTGGTTSDPAGLMIEVTITPTPTSGLEFSYLLNGL